MAEMAQSDSTIAYVLLERAKKYAADNPYQALDHAQADLELRHIVITSLTKRMATSWIGIVLTESNLDAQKYPPYTALECRLILSMAQYVGEVLSHG